MSVECYTYKFNPKTLSVEKTAHPITSDKLKHYEKIENIVLSIDIGMLILFFINIILLVIFDVLKIEYPILHFIVVFAVVIFGSAIVMSKYDDKITEERQRLELMFYKDHSNEKKQAEMLLYDWCIRHPDVKINADKFNISLYDAYVLTYRKMP